jgi:hypothetical protein
MRNSLACGQWFLEERILPIQSRTRVDHLKSNRLPHPTTYIHPLSSTASMTFISLPGLTLFFIPNFDLDPSYKYQIDPFSLTNDRRP